MWKLVSRRRPTICVSIICVCVVYVSECFLFPFALTAVSPCLIARWRPAVRMESLYCMVSLFRWLCCLYLQNKTIFLLSLIRRIFAMNALIRCIPTDVWYFFFFCPLFGYRWREQFADSIGFTIDSIFHFDENKDGCLWDFSFWLWIRKYLTCNIWSMIIGIHGCLHAICADLVVFFSGKRHSKASYAIRYVGQQENWWLRPKWFRILLHCTLRWDIEYMKKKNKSNEHGWLLLSWWDDYGQR